MKRRVGAMLMAAILALSCIAPLAEEETETETETEIVTEAAEEGSDEGEEEIVVEEIEEVVVVEEGEETEEDTEEASEEAPAEEAAASDYIAAPYAIDAEMYGPTEYLDPVFYENEDGPTIGVTLVGVIVEDGLYFKDSNNDGVLDPYEDWRLDTETRVADLISKMTTQQRLGLTFNQLMCTPSAASAEDCYDENGNVILDSLMTVTPDALNMVVETEAETEGEATVFNPAAGSAEASAADRPNSTGEMLTYESRSGVVRAWGDATVGALWTNATNMVAEYDAAATGEPTIPFIIIANPMYTNYSDAPGTLGFTAAAMGLNDYSIIEEFAQIDSVIWDAKGITRMYGPQIDLITDPRWPRDNTTFTEDPDVNAQMATALVTGYQNGTDGIQPGDVALMIKHFPGDGSSYNGFESHNKYGESRVYATEGSLENYQLVGFQAAVDAGVAGIMPGYSMQVEEGVFGSVAQSYQGVEIPSEDIANAYNSTILTTLLRDTMGFDGFINTDSGVLTQGMQFGAEDMSEPERYAMIINAGADVIGDSFAGVDWSVPQEAYEQGLVEEEALTRANTNILSVCFDQGLFENPYKDVEESVATIDEETAELAEVMDEISLGSVVLLKNANDALPLTDASQTVYVKSFTNSGSDDAAEESFTAAFEAAGYTVVGSADEANIAFLDVVPGGFSTGMSYMGVLDLVDGLEVDEYNGTLPITEAKTGDTIDVTTLADVNKIADIAETVHANGGKVIASIDISNPWILTNLEPYCDGLIASFQTNVSSRMAVLTGEYNPTGVLPVSLVSCNEVIAVEEYTDENGYTYDKCVSPNDVPGYDKDQYIDADVLAQSPSGSYTYMDTEGNYYGVWFGLSY